MLISCLLPTEDRPEFAEFTARNFLRQTWKDTELVLAPSDTPGDEVFSTVLRKMIPADRLRIMPPFPAGTPRGVKWQGLLAEARGDAVTMWGDDDWYDRDRLEIPAMALVRHRDAVVAVLSASCYNLNVRTMLCDASGPPKTFYMGCMVARTADVRREAPFRPVAYAVDGAWLRDLQMAFEGAGRFVHCASPPDSLMVVVLYHGKNSIQAGIESCDSPVESLQGMMPTWEWPDFIGTVNAIRAIHFPASCSPSGEAPAASVRPTGKGGAP